jgi:hypothetical protein
MSRPPPLAYLLVNLPLGVLWLFGLPALAWTHFDLPGWLVLLASVPWLLLSGRVVDRWIPSLANPVLEALWALIGPRR